MTTDHACHTAVELATRSLVGMEDHTADNATGAAVLAVVLDGLYATLTGMLVQWHTGLSDRLLRALGVPIAETAGLPPERRLTEWEALADVKSQAQRVLTVLADHARQGAAGPRDLPARLALVEDALAGTLRRMSVPSEASVRGAADLAVAAGSLFGLYPAPPPPSAPPPAPGPAERTRRARTAPSSPHVHLSDWAAGLP